MHKLLHICCFVAIAFSLLGTSCNTTQQSNEKALATDTMYYAKGIDIQYFDNYIKVDIKDPWDSLKIRNSYILAEKSILKDNPGLKTFLSEKGQLVTIPVNKAAVYTSVHASMIEQLGCIESICGVCEPQYITSEAIQARIANGNISDLGLATSPNVEKILEMQTEIIIASPYENCNYGAAEKLGIPIIEAADYMEGLSLGRSEWIKFIGLLFGERAKADSIFADTEASYINLKNLISSISDSDKPKVILERKYGQSWSVPSGESYIGRLHADAGADYVYSTINGADSKALAFETVLDNAKDADFWLLKYGSANTFSYDDLKKEYLPYSFFDAFEKHHIYVCNTMTTSYYEDLTLHPDWILADLISIYHPQLLPGYQPRYYFPMAE